MPVNRIASSSSRIVLKAAEVLMQRSQLQATQGMKMQHLAMLAFLMDATDEDHPWDVSEIIEFLRSSRSTGSLILKNLADLGFINRSRVVGSKKFSFYTNAKTVGDAIATYSDMGTSL
jgi:DNA-binding MarR family transcriptional regulator